MICLSLYKTHLEFGIDETKVLHLCKMENKFDFPIEQLYELSLLKNRFFTSVIKDF